MIEKQEKIFIYKLFIVLFIIAFSFFTLIIVFCKKTTYSSYEKRPTKTFPVFSFETLKSSNYFKEIDDYLIDSVPFRDLFLDKVNYLLNLKGLKNVATIIETPTEEYIKPNEANNIEKSENIISTSSNISSSYISNTTFPTYNEYENPTLYMKKNGAIVVSDGKSIRGMFGPGPWSATNSSYAAAINEYVKSFPNINIYTMIIPMAVAYYAPPKDIEYQKNTINSLKSLSTYFDSKVKQVDVYNALLPHMTEDIYLRTDHHWSQLGAYYAAKEFAKDANVDFETLDKYDMHTVENYCGTLYQKTGITEFKDIGETFTYYTPNNINYSNERATFKVNSDQKAVSRTDFIKSNFFYEKFLNKTEAYMVFMAGDVNVTHVTTETKNNRNLLILKDSFGNAVIPNLFYSFENIYVVDYRYFVDNFKEFVNEKEITDMLFINSISSCKADSGGKLYLDLLNMEGTTYENTN